MGDSHMQITLLGFGHAAAGAVEPKSTPKGSTGAVTFFNQGILNSRSYVPGFSQIANFLSFRVSLRIPAFAATEIIQRTSVTPILAILFDHTWRRHFVLLLMQGKPYLCQFKIV
jgi:hypothetical protein